MKWLPPESTWMQTETLMPSDAIQNHLFSLSNFLPHEEGCCMLTSFLQSRVVAYHALHRIFFEVAGTWISASNQGDMRESNDFWPFYTKQHPSQLKPFGLSVNSGKVQYLTFKRQKIAFPAARTCTTSKLFLVFGLTGNEHFTYWLR